MERLAEADNDEEARDHRIIARWIKHFTEYVPEQVEAAYQASEKKPNGAADTQKWREEGGSPYMESDGGPPVDEEAL